MSTWPSPYSWSWWPRVDDTLDDVANHPRHTLSWGQVWKELRPHPTAPGSAFARRPPGFLLSRVKSTFLSVTAPAWPRLEGDEMHFRAIAKGAHLCQCRQADERKKGVPRLQSNFVGLGGPPTAHRTCSGLLPVPSRHGRGYRVPAPSRLKST